MNSLPAGTLAWPQRSCNPSATPADIAACEASMGEELPAALKDLLSVFNGQRYDESVVEFPGAPFSRFLSADAIPSLHASMPQIVAA
jgi:cell wall assembly regulator SMI1